MNPKPFRLAISPTWDCISDNIIAKKHKDSILILLSGYVTQLNHNNKLIAKKVKIFRAILVFIFIVTLLLISLYIISLMGV